MSKTKTFDCIAFTREQRARISAEIEQLGWDGFLERLRHGTQSNPLWRHLERAPLAPVVAPRERHRVTTAAGAPPRDPRGNQSTPRLAD